MSFRPLTEPYAEVATLPANIAAISTPSKAIERLLSRRQNAHNSALNSFKLTCERCNSETEEEIQKATDRFAKNSKRIRNQIENELEILRRPPDEILNLTPEAFQKVQEIVRNDNRPHLVDDLYGNLKILEKDRCVKLKKALNDAYRQTTRVSHLLPVEILDFFETEIVKLNGITINNHAYYARLCSDLSLQIQDEIRLHLLEIAETKDKHKMATKMAKIKELVGSRRAGEGKLPEISISRTLDPRFSTDVPRTVVDAGIWTRQMKMTLDYLDTNAKKLVYLYKTAVVHVFNRFFERLDEITAALAEDENLSQIDVDVDDETFQSVIQDVTELYKCDVEELQHLWDTITDYMETNINNTSLFLNSSAHLWDGYFNRTADLRNLALQDIKLEIDKNDRAAQNLDKKIHVLLDKLRQESCVAKLDKLLDDVNKFLDSISRLYEKQCDAEIKILSKYQKGMDDSIELLISEIDRFLTEAGTNTNIQERKSAYNRQDEDGDANGDLIPVQMKECQFGVEAVNNWMFGLWETIRQYMTTCHKELSDQAQEWMDKTTTKLKKRLEIRLATQKPRYLRLKSSIYDVRLQELQDHIKSYQKLEERIDQCTSKSTTSTQTSSADRFRHIEGFQEGMRELEGRLKRATRSFHVASCIEQTKANAEETRKKLNGSFKENFEQLQENSETIKKLLCNFSSSIRLFPKGGSYSRAEAQIYRKKLDKLKRTAPKKHNQIFGEFDSKATQTLYGFEETVAAILERMERSRAEFDHKETVCGKIRELRLRIRNRAFDTKFRLHRLGARMDHGRIGEMADQLVSSRGYGFRLATWIDDSYADIETASRAFYATHGPVINKGKLRADFGSFMEEVKANYDGFRKQVEVHCLECVQDLVRHVLKLLKSGENPTLENFLKGEILLQDEERMKTVHSTVLRLMAHVRQQVISMVPIEEEVESKIDY